MAGHNGGLGQIEVVSTNIFLDKWVNARPDPNNFDITTMGTNGLPTAMPGAGKVLSYAVPNPKAGDMKIWWDGTLDWTVGNATVLSSGSNWKIIRPGPQDNILFTLKSLTVAPTYIHLTMTSTEAAFLGGEYLEQEFIDDMLFLKPGKIRFMNSASASGSDALFSSHLTTESDVGGWGGGLGYKFSHAANKIATAVKDPNTAVDEYDLTVASWAGTHGDTCWLPITAALASTTLGTTYHAMKIGINGGPRKPVRIYSQFSEYIFDVQKFQASNGKYTVAMIRYNALFDCYVIKGGQIREQPWIGANKGSIPYSMAAKICTRFGAHIHFTLPAMAASMNDTSCGSAIAQACADVHANLGPGLIAHPELGNEIWNTARGFWYSSYAAEANKKRYNKTTAGSIDQEYGRMLAIAAPVIHAAFGGNKARYQLPCGLKTFSNNISSTTGTPRISAQEAVANEGITSGRAFIDEIMQATYYNPDLQPQGVTPSATNPRWIPFMYWAKKHRDAVTNGDVVNKAKAIRALVDSALVTLFSSGSPQPESAARITQNYNNAKSAYPGILCSFYEGGYSSQLITAEPTINLTGTDPEGNAVTYAGVQPTGTKAMFNAFVTAGRYEDPKLQWIAFQWYRKWHDTPGYRFPSRYGYGPGGTLGDWVAKDVGGQYDQDALGFAAFSNGDSIMLMSCA